ncbi:hypothetical protein [Streptomyces sp. 6N223]|uniref:hypothetical protein n=1 Tax=Streptomyces sp. 6N223 TaxID=3457412 RepID=UPI003FD5E13E
MYRYAFRLGDRDLSLGDGFGWTILLVGDSGEVTREFLLRYGVELSVKTAHRVRFAFFSGLALQGTDHVAMGRRLPGHSARGFLDRLQAGLGRTRRGRQPLDWEGDGWREPVLLIPRCSEIPDEAVLPGDCRKILAIVRAADGPVQVRGIGEELGVEVRARGKLEPLRAKLTKLADRGWLHKRPHDAHISLSPTSWGDPVDPAVADTIPAGVRPGSVTSSGVSC